MVNTRAEEKRQQRIAKIKARRAARGLKDGEANLGDYVRSIFPSYVVGKLGKKEQIDFTNETGEPNYLHTRTDSFVWGGVATAQYYIFAKEARSAPEWVANAIGAGGDLLNVPVNEQMIMDGGGAIFWLGLVGFTVATNAFRFGYTFYKDKEPWGGISAFAGLINFGTKGLALGYRKLVPEPTRDWVFGAKENSLEWLTEEAPGKYLDITSDQFAVLAMYK